MVKKMGFSSKAQLGAPENMMGWMMVVDESSVFESFPGDQASCAIGYSVDFDGWIIMTNWWIRWMAKPVDGLDLGFRKSSEGWMIMILRPSCTSGVCSGAMIGAG